MAETLTTPLDVIISAGVIAIVVGLIGSRIYNHEKEHIDPLIRKVKSWITPNEEEDSYYDGDDFEIAYRGQYR